jgi:flagellar hook assembly protein FlgD
VEGQPSAGAVPQSFSLSPCYPNPFNAATAFALYVPGERSALVTLRIYNILGQEVRTLIEGSVDPGSHLVLWDGTDGAGADLASGVYFARMASANFAQTRKVVLNR